MRTTINLPHELLTSAKKQALAEDTTLTELIANALREFLARRKKRTGNPKFEVHTFGSGGVMPGVDLDDTAGLLDILDGYDDPNRR
jgi:hypothetical protein